MAFSLLVHGTQLTNAIKRLESLVGGTNQNALLTLQYKDNELWLYQASSRSENIRVKHRLEVKGKKSGTITVNSSVLAGITRRNQELLLEYKDKELLVSNQQAYSAKCLTVKAEVSTKIIGKKVQQTGLPKKLQKILIEALSKLELKDHFQSETPIVISVWASKKRTLIAASDNYHGGIYQAKGYADLEFHLTINYVNQLTSLLSEFSDVQLGVDSNCFYFWTDDLEVAWPLVAPKAKASKFQEIFARPDSKIPTAQVQRGDVTTILNNLKPLYEKLSHLRLESSKKAITFQVRSTRGSAKESIGFSGSLPKAELAINPQLFEDVITLVPEEFTMAFNKDLKAMIFECQLEYGRANYQVLLSPIK